MYHEDIVWRRDRLRKLVGGTKLSEEIASGPTRLAVDPTLMASLTSGNGFGRGDVRSSHKQQGSIK